MKIRECNKCGADMEETPSGNFSCTGCAYYINTRKTNIAVASMVAEFKRRDKPDFYDYLDVKAPIIQKLDHSETETKK